MSQPQQGDQQVVVMGADGQPVGSVTMGADGSVEPSRQQSPRTSSSSRQGDADRLDGQAAAGGGATGAAGRRVPARLREVHRNSIAELSDGLAPELQEELSG
jgi:hypothetical protein